MHPWSSPDLEQAVLGTALMHADAARTIATMLTPDHFKDGRNRVVWEAIGEVIEAGRIPDTPAVAQHITQTGRAQSFGSGTHPHYPYLGDLQRLRGATANLENYLYALDEASVEGRRKKVSEAIAAGDMDTQAATDALAEIEAGLPLRGAGEDAPAHMVGVTARQEHVEQMAREGRKFSGLNTGFDAFNRRIDGIRPGELTVLAASPSIGKTTLALQIALNVMKNEGAPVGFFSLEMTNVQLAERAISILAGANPFQLLRDGAYLESPEYKQAAERFNSAKVSQWAPLPFSGYYTQNTLAELRQTLTTEHKRQPRPLWVVDHLHHMNLLPLASSRHEQLGIAAKEFSRLSKDLNTHIILLGQLNRNFKNRTDYRPQLTDLREAGGIEEAADNAVLIYRPGFYPELVRAEKEMGRDLDAFEQFAMLQFEKARHIGVGEAEVAWVPDQAIYANAAPASYGPPPNMDADFEAIERFN